MSRTHTTLRKLLPTLVVLIPSLLGAHPGHDGGHDLTWDFASGPLSGWLGVFVLLGCLATLIGVVGHILKSRSSQSLP